MSQHIPAPPITPAGPPPAPAPPAAAAPMPQSAPPRQAPRVPAAPSAPPPPPPNARASSKTFSVNRGLKSVAHKIVIYGSGGVGKTTLASLAPSPVVLDVESGSAFIDVPRVDGINSIEDLRAALDSPEIVNGFQTIVVDSVTRVEQLLAAHVCATKRTERGDVAKSLDDYGFGKGYNALFEAFVGLLQDFERVIARGQNLILIAHECTTSVPNPSGNDFLRYEPLVWQAKNGNNSLRQRLKDWCDHLLYIQYDISVVDGKARGGGSRTIYPQEGATWLAKSRSLRDPIVFAEGSDEVWRTLFRA